MQEPDAQVPTPPTGNTGNTLGDGNPPTNNNRLLAMVFGALAVLLVVLLAVLLVNKAIANNNPTAATVLDNAKKASLKDSQYTLQGQLALNFGGAAAGTTTPASNPSTSFAINGTGKLTISPVRNDVQVNVPALGVQTNLEALTDSNDIYVQLGALAGLAGISGSNANNWIKVSGGTTNTPMTILDSYSAIKNPTIVGSEKINGKDTWHIKGNLDTKGTANNATASAIGATATAVSKTSGLNASATATEDIWIIKDTYFPAQIMVHASVAASIPGGLLPTGGIGFPGIPTTGTETPTPTTGTASSSPVQLAVDLTASFTSWNTNLTITPPPASQVTDIGNGSGSGIFALPTASPTPVK